MKPQELWNTLYADGFVRQAEIPAVAPRPPWYMEALLFLAIWVGAAISVVAIFLIQNDDAFALLLGMALTGLAAWIFRARKGHFFLVQLAHAVSLCGAGSILFALISMTRNLEFMSYFLLALSVLVFWIMDNFVQRLGASCAAIVAVIIFCADYWGFHALWLESLYVGASLAFILVWQKEMNTRHYRRSQLLRSVGYALALFLTAAAVIRLSPFFYPLRPALFSAWREDAMAWGLPTLRLLSGLALPGFIALLLRGKALASNRLAWMLMGAALCVALLGVEMPFVATALLIIIVGFAANAAALMGIGMLMLLIVLGQYYYWLEASLLRKSVYLLLTGGLLLACRLAAKRLARPSEEGGEHV
jgi:hypothetical protein